MSMTKAEKARMEELETALALCWPPYPCPKPMTPDEIRAAPQVSAGMSFGLKRMGVPGFFINEHTVEISEGFSDGMYHSRHGGASWSQTGGVMYRTREEAIMALRHGMSRDFAKKLAEADRMLRDSDGSGEAIETALAGSTEGDSAGPKDIAQDQRP